jgi:hypothetical protein
LNMGNGKHGLRIILDSCIILGLVLSVPLLLRVTAQDLPRIFFDSGAYSVDEDSLSGSVTITVRLRSASAEPVAVRYTTTDVSAAAGTDYTGADRVELTIPAGETTWDFTIDVNNDDLDEEEESFTVTLREPVGARLGNPSTTTVTIIDDDGPPTVGFEDTTPSVEEGADPVDITVVLNAESGREVRVTYATTTGGTATAGSDYTATSDTLIFSPGDTSESFQVTINSDDLDEEDETVQLLLSEPVNATLANDAATLTILDDDDAGVQVAPGGVDVIEGGSTDQYQVVLSSEPRHPVIVSVSTDGQTSVSPSQLIFYVIDWDQAKTITVSAVDDSITEGLHSSTIRHTATSEDGNYNGLGLPNVTASIQDNDEAQILVDPASLEVSEPNGTAVFTIRLTSNPRPAVTIPLATSNNQCNVSLAAAVLDASNWKSGVSVAVSAVDDTAEEGDHICVVETGNSISDDRVYDNRTVSNVEVTVHDDGDQQVFLPLAPLSWPPVPGTPELQPISNPDGDGVYTVTWTATERAETYILEQAKDSGFATAVEIYDGPSTSLAVSGQVTGRHYYRVKAHNSLGDSTWSASQWVDMLWEAEPNNLPPDANGPLVSGLTYFGRFLSNPTALEYDYYYFDLPATGRVELWLRNIPSGQDYNLVLRDENLEPEVGYSGNRGNVNEHIVTDNLPAGRYYIQVWNYVGNGSTQPYQLQVTY